MPTSKPPLIVVFGNCQANGLYQTIKGLPEIRQTFRVVYHTIENYSSEKECWRSDVAEADVLLCQENEHTPVYFSEVSLNRATTNVLLFPSLSFLSLWPFDGMSGNFDWLALVKNRYGDTEFNFEFQDNMMARLRPAIPDPDARFRSYRALSTPTVPRLQRYINGLNFSRMFEMEANRMMQADQRHGMSVYAFILSHFRTMPMFHAATHPNGIVLLIMAVQCLAKLGIKIKPSAAHVVHYAAHYEVPVHPIVGECLGVGWADDLCRYQFRSMALTFEEYFRAYIRTYG